jgi:hypothetical protein
MSLHQRSHGTQGARETTSPSRPVAWLAHRRSGNANASPLVADWLREWIDSRLAIRPSTAASYRAHIERYLIPAIGG